MGGKITTQMPSRSKPHYGCYWPTNLSPVRSNTLDSETNSGVCSLNPLRKGPISNAEVAIERELEDILRPNPESECTLSDNILFYIAGNIVRLNPVQELIANTSGIVPTLCYMTQKTEAD